MSRLAYCHYDNSSTECDSSEERDQYFCTSKTNPLKHKTQLCKTYSELGYCNYGEKCRFAHGRHELVVIPKNKDLRNRKCNGYWGKCHCNYGVRCQFGHSEQTNLEDQIILQLARAAYSPNQDRIEGSKVIRLLSNN